MIHHRPIFDIDKAIQHYTEKDGVEIKYVCTSAPNAHAAYAADIFYRETPHPEFGNHYFGLFMNHDNQIMITNADNIETLEFGMKAHQAVWHYSQHRHDFYSIGDVALDGGRSYFRVVGNVNTPTKWFEVRNGEFVEKTDEVS